MSTERKVVITGIGVITPVGNQLASFWDAVTHGRSGIDTITAFDLTGHACHIAGEVKGFEPVGFFRNPKDVRRTDRYTQFGMAASKMALEDSGVDLDAVDRNRFGVVIGSGIGGLKTLSDQMHTMFNKGPGRISPFMIPMMISNMASGLVSMEYGLAGPNFSTVSACATACHAIGEAWRMIQHGDADLFLCGGAEATVVPIGIGGFAAMKALSTRNDEPQKASRPFDRDRDGFVMGEGAGVLLIEELEHAKRRGARIYCELAGYGLSADAYHMTSPLPEGEGAARCMQMALDKAGVTAGEVDYVNAHGTSTGLGDICETKAIKAVFGEHACPSSKDGLVVSSTKSMTGHLLGAAGAVEMAACVMAIRDGLIPPTINLDNPDPECDLDYVPHVARERKVRVAVNNSFGFGGHNATLIAKAFEG
ncbi:MAG TPA: beta-ketoacyl-ACP synthase II [Chthoniobacteraceae bacterium]|nr:beta-ketoacyl-ACP synthase II [Chthoniobacteraceae bacterium]